MSLREETETADGGEEALGICAQCGSNLYMWEGCYRFGDDAVCRGCALEYLDANGYGCCDW